MSSTSPIPADSLVPVFGGDWAYAQGFPVFSDSGGRQYYIAFTFILPSPQATLNVKWFGSPNGMPPPYLLASLYTPVGTLLQSVHQPSSSIPNTTGWQGPITFNGPFPAGTYTVVFTAPLGDLNNCYSIWLSSYRVTDGSGSYNVPQPNPVVGGSSGDPFLWVQDGAGNDVNIYPMRNQTNQPGTTELDVPVTFSTGVIMLWLSDRHFNPVTGIVTITDLTGGGVAATAVLDQAVIRSSGTWTPVNLDRVAQFTGGHRYQVSIVDSDGGYSWPVVVRGEQVDPAKAGPLGQGQILNIRIPVASAYHQLYSDVYSATTTGADAISSTIKGAVRFIPSSSGKVTAVRLAFRNNQLSGQYPPGTPLTFSICADSGGQLYPPNKSGLSQPAAVMQSVTTDSGSVPANGFLDVTGFSVPMSAGTRYWLVLSTPGPAAFSLMRLVTCYKFEVLKNGAGDSFWTFDAEGPTDWSFKVTLDNGEQIGNFISDFAKVSTSYIGQSFIAPSTMTVSGVYIGSVHGAGGGYIEAGIYPDAGGTPNLGAPFAKGKHYAAWDTWSNDAHFMFDAGFAQLVQGTKYWIIIGPGTSGGVVAWAPAYYLMPTGVAPGLYSDTGSSWSQLGPGAVFTHGLFEALGSPPPPPGPVPTTLTLVAAQL